MQFTVAVQSGVVCGHLGFSWLYLLAYKGSNFSNTHLSVPLRRGWGEEGAPNLELNSMTLWVKPWALGWA